MLELLSNFPLVEYQGIKRRRNFFLASLFMDKLLFLNIICDQMQNFSVINMLKCSWREWRLFSDCLSGDMMQFSSPSLL